MNKQILTSIIFLYTGCAYLFAQEASSSVKSAYTAGYWQQEVHYAMNIVVDAHIVYWRATCCLYDNSPDVIDRIFYHLYFNAFQPGSMMDVRSRTIEDPDGRVRDRIFNLSEDEIGYHAVQSLRQDGQDLDFDVEGTILVAPLASPLLPGEQTVLDGF